MKFGSITERLKSQCIIFDFNRIYFVMKYLSTRYLLAQLIVKLMEKLKSPVNSIGWTREDLYDRGKD